MGFLVAVLAAINEMIKKAYEENALLRTKEGYSEKPIINVIGFESENGEEGDIGLEYGQSPAEQARELFWKLLGLKGLCVFFITILGLEMISSLFS